MNKSILITGANAGIGKETARQLALIPETEKIYLACRNADRARAAKEDPESATGRNIFEIVIMDVSDPESVKKAVNLLDEPIDALVMNAGGMGGKHPDFITKEGVTTIFATNVLGHVVLLEELLERELLRNVALYASSEAARGVKKMGMKRPSLTSGSVKEFVSIIDGSYFGDKLDGMQAYGPVKAVGTLWMSSLARKYQDIRFISMSPGGTSGTNAMDDLTGFRKILFKYIMMPVMMPMMGMAHKLEKGAARFVNGINDETLESGVFYGSKENVLVGPLVDQSSIFPALSNTDFQNHAREAVTQFI